MSRCPMNWTCRFRSGNISPLISRSNYIVQPHLVAADGKALATKVRDEESSGRKRKRDRVTKEGPGNVVDHIG